MYVHTYFFIQIQESYVYLIWNLELGIIWQLDLNDFRRYQRQVYPFWYLINDLMPLNSKFVIGCNCWQLRRRGCLVSPSHQLLVCLLKTHSQTELQLIWPTISLETGEANFRGIYNITMFHVNISKLFYINFMDTFVRCMTWWNEEDCLGSLTLKAEIRLFL